MYIYILSVWSSLHTFSKIVCLKMATSTREVGQHLSKWLERHGDYPKLRTGDMYEFALANSTRIIETKRARGEISLTCPNDIKMRQFREFFEMKRRLTNWLKTHEGQYPSLDSAILHEKKIAYWVADIRVTAARNNLSEGLEKELEQMGFVWSSNEAEFRTDYAKLLEWKEFLKTHTADQYPAVDEAIVTQIHNKLRLAFTNGTLANDQIKRLVEIDFRFC